MKKVFAPIAAAAMAAAVAFAPAAQAGGSGDFYYGPVNSATVCGFYGQATNYDRPTTTGQTYHWAFKSVDSGYTPQWIQFSGTGGKTIYSPGYGGYTNFTSESADHTITFAVRSPSGGTCTASISYTAWR